MEVKRDCESQGRKLKDRRRAQQMEAQAFNPSILSNKCATPYHQRGGPE